ncbi:ROK family protein [Lacticaseibacillus parakribbianus]|uniref:ROK family protein n=1 Tax=Lacticaseibacillus parakribbianus TaxID=2970927 RepID=UPI0021CAFAB9|nr:ROK family protein [Lacticaseibacillus parakribbianus]
MSYLCIDIGGTAIKWARFARDGSPVTERQEVLTRKTATSNQILEQVVRLVQAERASGPIEGVAISSAGVVDAEAGVIRSAGPTIPGYAGTDFKAAITGGLGLPCAVENDVNCMALAEASQVAVRNVFALTIGTGIGGAVVLNQRLYTGKGSAGEIGYLPLFDGRTYQEAGCTQALVDLVNATTEREVATGRDVAAWFGCDAGVALATTTWLGRIAKGIVTINYIVDPDLFIVGGGIMESNPALVTELEDLANAAMEPSFTKPIVIRRAALGNSAGMIGALRHLLAAV